MHKPTVLLYSFSGTDMTHVAFVRSAMGLRTPEADVVYRHITRMPIHAARQQACETAILIEKDLNITHVCMIDDDQCDIPENAISRLLAHDKDFVAAFVYTRHPPYLPNIYDLGSDGKYHNIDDNRERTGLIKAGATGFGMVLIKVSAIKKLYEQDKNLFGYWGEVGEDIFFCRRMEKAGLQMFMDTNLIIGHLGAPIVVNEGIRKDWISKNGLPKKIPTFEEAMKLQAQETAKRS